MPSSYTREFNHSLYAPSAIDHTQKAYEEYVHTSVSHGENSTTVDFSVNEEDGEVLIDAFCNHALFLTIENFRGQNES